MTRSYSGAPWYSRFARLASSRSRSRSIRRRVSSVMLAVAQEVVDELAFRRDQLAGQRGAGGGDVVVARIERIRKLVDADIVARAQQAHHLLGDVLLLGQSIQ